MREARHLRGGMREEEEEEDKEEGVRTNPVLTAHHSVCVPLRIELTVGYLSFEYTQFYAIKGHCY